MSSSVRPFPLLSGRGVILGLVLSVILCWPMWVFGSYFVFADTASYFRGGAMIWQTLTDLLPASSAVPPADSPAGAGSLTVDAGGTSTVGRSFTYSALIYAIASALDYWAVPILQAFTALIFIFALIDDRMIARPALLLGGFALVAGLTTLPWYAVYLMPDIFAGTIILYAALMIGRYDDLTPRQRVVLTTLAALLVTFHYGYPPLMAGLAAFVLIWRLVQRRLTVGFAAAAIVPLLFAPLLNMAASSAVLGEASAMPQRLPILLARSLEDGPAYWYLKDACPQAGHALCELFGDDLPDNVGGFLWKDGVTSMSASDMDRIRDEEFEVLAHAFVAHPVAQTWSLLGNAARQAVMIGTGDIDPATGFDAHHTPVDGGAPARAALHIFDPIVEWATWFLSLPLLLLLVSGRLSPQHRAVATTALVGVLLNAAIFGGLSAPVDRYQSRVIWILPVLSVLFLTAWNTTQRSR